MSRRSFRLVSFVRIRVIEAPLIIQAASFAASACALLLTLLLPLFASQHPLAFFRQQVSLIQVLQPGKTGS